MQDKPLAATGPYQFLERAQAQYLRFQRVSWTHWRNTPDFPEVEFRFFKEPSTILAALLAKEIQVAALPLEVTQQAERAGFRAIARRAKGLRAQLNFKGVWVNKRINPDEYLNPDPNATFVYPNSPLMDVRVRKALNKAIDRDALNKAFAANKGEPIYNNYFDTTRPGWSPRWEQAFKQAYGYDPEAARKLLTEAGYGPTSPLTTTMRLSPEPAFPSALDMQEAIAGQWRTVGIDVKLEQIDPVIAGAKDRRNEYDNAVRMQITAQRQFAAASNANGMVNRNGAQFPQLNEIYDRISVTLDPKETDTLWRQWGDFAYNNYANVPLFWLPAFATVDPSIVADYPFPGTVTNIYTHVDYIKAAR